jgi:hypothetical protein
MARTLGGTDGASIGEPVWFLGSSFSLRTSRGEEKRRPLCKAFTENISP